MHKFEDLESPKKSLEDRLPIPIEEEFTNQTLNVTED
jgi:hypothetical protein